MQGTVSFQTVLPDTYQGSIQRLPTQAPAVSGAPSKKIKDKELALKGLILPSAPVLQHDGGLPPLVAEGGEDARRTEDMSRGGKVVDPAAGLVSWSAAELSNPVLALEKGDIVEFKGADMSRAWLVLASVRHAGRQARREQIDEGLDPVEQIDERLAMGVVLAPQ